MHGTAITHFCVAQRQCVNYGLSMSFESHIPSSEDRTGLHVATKYFKLNSSIYRSQWLRSLKHGSTAAHLLGLRVWISPGTWMSAPIGAGPPHSQGFLDHTRRTTVSRTPLDEWSARRRDLYLKTHNTHRKQTSMLPVGFKPTISAGKLPQTYALDRAATGTS